MKTKLMIFTALTFFMLVTVAVAGWENTAKVTVIEVTNIPNILSFKVDKKMTNVCPEGGWLTWYATGNTVAERSDNIKSVLSVLLTAQTTQQDIWIKGVNANCQTNYIHIHKN